MIIVPRQSISEITSASAVSNTTRGNTATTTVTSSVAPQPTGGDLNNIDTDQVPVCVQNCVKFGDVSECIKDQTQTCICKSQKYLGSVDTCYSQTCDTTEYAYGKQFSVGICAYVGVNISTVLPQPTSTAVDLTTAPETYSKSFINLQAIFSTICSLLLVLAIILGFLACRTKYKQEKQSQAGSWTNMQTIQSKTAVKSQMARNLSKPSGSVGVNSSFAGVSGGDSTFDPTATYATSNTNNFGMSSNFTSSGKNKKKGLSVFDPTKTFEDDDDDYDDYVDLGKSRNSGGGGGLTTNGRNKKGFTNRDLGMDEVDNLSISNIDTKDIIIEKKNGEGSGSGSGSQSSSSSDLGIDDKKIDENLGGGGGLGGKGGLDIGDEPITPTTTNHGGNRSEIDLNGSTVHLNTLDKGDGPKDSKG